MSPSQFKDRFGAIASSYAKYRPSYPATLFQQIADQAPRHRRCWDCATGNGQAARALADHFQEVIATDASESQIALAPSHAGVTYRCELAQATSLADHSVDAITVASALHWLPRPAFYDEVRRVAADGAVIAVWTYSAVANVSPEVDAVLHRLVHELLAPYWGPEFEDVRTGYRDVSFPFDRISTAPYAIDTRWTLDDLLGHTDTRSASARFQSERGTRPSALIRAELLDAWGEAGQPRRVTIPLYVRMGRVSPVPSVA